MDYWDFIEQAHNDVDIYSGPESFFQGFSVLPKPVQHLLAANWCWSEVNNGGLDQFFVNPTGVLAPEAVIGFRAIGLPEAADAVAAAMAMFGPVYPRDREERDAILETMPHHRTESKFGGVFRHVDAFDDLDTRFFSATENFAEVADAYAAANAE